MEYYRNGIKHKFDNVLNDVDFQLFVNGELNGTIIEETVVITIDYEGDFYKDLAFGKSLVEKFLIDNRNLATNFTDSQNLKMLQSFAPIQTLCNSGVIKTARAMLANVVIDSIFTQSRKDEYLQIIDNYLTK